MASGVLLVPTENAQLRGEPVHFRRVERRSDVFVSASNMTMRCGVLVNVESVAITDVLIYPARSGQVLDFFDGGGPLWPMCAATNSFRVVTSLMVNDVRIKVRIRDDSLIDVGRKSFCFDDGN